MKMLNTFLRELTTQSKTALSFGTRLMVLSGLRTRRTRKDLMVLRFCPVELPLINEKMKTSLRECWSLTERQKLLWHRTLRRHQASSKSLYSRSLDATPSLNQSSRGEKRRACSDSHHVKDKGNDGANHHQRVHQVPNVAQIRSWMGYDAQVDDLQRY